MTTQQAGREAFEAWWKDCEIAWADEPEHFAWAAWQDALAQQDFPARFFANGPQGSAWFDDLSLASAMVAAFDKDDDWTITDTQDTPAPKQQAMAGRSESE